MKSLLNGKVTLYAGDCLDVLRSLPDDSIDSVCTDPPYALVSIVKRFGKEGSAPINNRDEREGRNGPYHCVSRGFMGKKWDTGERAFSVEFWTEVFRVLKPGGHVLSFGGTRTYHRLVCAIEDAGFEIRDQIGWAFGSGFPKSHDVSKGIDKAAGAEREKITKVGAPGYQRSVGNTRPWMDDPDHKVDPDEPATDAARQWQGWGTALKPAWEPICLARKPLEGTVAANVLKHGVGALNIDGCRVSSTAWATEDSRSSSFAGAADSSTSRATAGTRASTATNPAGPAPRGRRPGGFGNVGAPKGSNRPNGHTPPEGRWPANLIHDGSEEVVGAFPESKDGVAVQRNGGGQRIGNIVYSGTDAGLVRADVYGGQGSAARFFYSAKADKDDRLGSKHPTVKPVDLMQYLVRLVTPKGGLVLDPFAGTGTTGEAAFREGMRAILIEREPEYLADIERRMKLALAGPDERKHATIKARGKAESAGPLFGETAS